MRVSALDVERAFEDLLAGTRSRVEIAEWASRAMQSEDLGTLEYDPPSAEERIWEGILYLLGADLKAAPGLDLHHEGDFREFFDRWRESR